MNRNLGNISKRDAIVRDWRDGYTAERSAEMRGCTVEWVNRVRCSEWKRQQKLRRERERLILAMRGVVGI